MSSFIRRHRRKLIWGGAAVGGLVIAARIVERQMIKSREEEGRLALEKVRKQNHFESTESTCNSTLVHILHQLKLKILLEYQTNTLTDALRGGPSGDEKVRIWEQIKIISFCRTSAYIISFSFIGVLLRVQLNVLAGHLFTTRVSVSSLLNNNRDSSSTPLSARVQEQYLQLSKHFIDQGFSELCEILFVIIKQSVDSKPLQEKLKISDLEKIFQQILHSLFTESKDRNLFLNPGKFLLSSSQYPSDLKPDELDLFSVLVSETLEILEQDEVLELARRISQQGFAFITDKLAESFDTSQPPNSAATFKEDPETSSDENARSVSGKDQIQVDDAFTSPCGISMPLVKLLPVLLSVVQEDELDEEEEEEEETDEWIQHIIMNVDLKILGANIYETFCFKEQSTAQQQTWTQFISSSVSSLF